VAEAQGVQRIQHLNPSQIADGDGVLPGVSGALVVVKTNEGRFSKLLLKAARQRIGAQAVPILLIERFVTYREGEERTVQAAGTNVHLFAGFQFSLDLGQVVPAELGGDLRWVTEQGKAGVDAVGKAQMYLVTAPLAVPEVRSEKLVIGQTFEPRYFNGSFRLFDDGRRSGTLKLHVEDDGSIIGSYYSDKDGQKYDVFGTVGNPKHAVQFTIKFPRTQQVFQGWLFTGDGKALAGSSRLQDRETGFYALREEDK
jgi:hypothetical protein